MQAILIVSAASNQSILSTRISHTSTRLISATLDALSQSDASIIYLPDVFPLSAAQPSISKRNGKGKQPSRHLESYDSTSSSDASSDAESDEQLEDATNAWSTSNQHDLARKTGACCCVLRKNDLKFIVPLSTDCA